MARLLGHRQTKETATDKPNLLMPRHIPTLPTDAFDADSTSLIRTRGNALSVARAGAIQHNKPPPFRDEKG